MIRIRRLYSEPEVFDEIKFKDGLNLILGEKSDESTTQGRKTNGVGKSLCVEFINYCFLKKASESRVLQIPIDLLPKDFKVILDTEVNGKIVTIVRSVSNPNIITITSEGIEKSFDSSEVALLYLSDLLFNFKDKSGVPSLRALLAPLIRDEASAFKNIVNYFDTDRRIPDDITPVLYYLGFDLSAYLLIRKTIENIDAETKFINKLQKELTNNGEKTLSAVKSELNSINDEMQKLQSAIESLRSNEAFESIEDDLVKLENKIDKLKSRHKAISVELNRIATVPKPDEIKERDVAILYEQFKQGLGDLVERSLAQVKDFKDRIEKFQTYLIEEKVKELKDERLKLSKIVKELDRQYSEKLSVLNHEGVMKDIRGSIAYYNKQSESVSKIRSQFADYDKAAKHKNILISEKEGLIVEIDKQIDLLSETIKNFNNTVLDIHQQLMGNKEASFDIQTVRKKDSKSKRKEVIDIEMRIRDDGSHSVDRTKVFIFDVSLLFNADTRTRHPSFLIHDNIFDVDQDTLVESLNFMADQEILNPDFQYILTLNRDKIEGEERSNKIKFDVDAHKRETFTKGKRFLKFQYQEIPYKRRKDMDPLDSTDSIEDSI